MTADDRDEFSQFRRARKRRQLTEEWNLPAGEHQDVTRQLEEVEAKEAQESRLNREVHDFFADATRTAAQMVSQVSESAEREHAVHVAQEMSEFLADTLRRAQQFVVAMHSGADPNVARREVHPNMHNLVGAPLDGFRHEGNSAARENHIGVDPFAVDVDPGTVTPDAPTAEFPSTPTVEFPPTPPVDVPAPVPSEAAPVDEEVVRKLDEHLVAESVLQSDPEPLDPEEVVADWFRALCQDEERVKAALRALVRSQSMSREEARAVWCGLNARD